MSDKFRYSTCFSLLLLAAAAFAQPADVHRVLDRVIEAYGGESNVRKLDSQVQEWTIVAIMGNRHGTDVRALRPPDRLKVVLTYPDRSETRVVDRGSGVVVYGNGPPQVAVRPQLDAMRLQLMRLYSPLVLRDKSDALTLSVEGEHAILTLVEDGIRADYIVNTDNWRIEKFVGGIAINGAEMQFVTEYADFAVHDGVLVHQAERKYAGGTRTAVLRLRRIVVDADLRDADFGHGGGSAAGTGDDPDDAI